MNNFLILSKNLIVIFSLLTWFLSCSSHSDMTCPTGEHLNHSSLVCVPDCSPGQSFLNGACTLCQPATVPNFDQTQCNSCQAGTFNNLVGATSCLPCSPGASSQSGAITCTLCQPGSYSSTGASSCKTCEMGTFTSNTGSASCTPCPDGMTSSVDFTSCVNL
jgi:hypothetical protein